MREELTAAFAALNVKVAELTTVEASAEALLNGLNQRMSDAIANAGDPSQAIAAVQEVMASIASGSAALAAAVAAGTPTPDPIPSPDPTSVA